MKIVITGSCGLIGKTLVKKFSEDHVDVLELDLELGHDLTDEAFVKNFFNQCKPDALIICHAIDDKVTSDRGLLSVMDIELDNLSKVFEVNVVSALSVAREYMRNSQKGSVVFFSSIYGDRSPRKEIYGDAHKFIGYGLSKSAIINMTKYLAVHCAPNFRFNCLLPGGVSGNETKEFRESYSKLVPLGRMMLADELYGLVSYLISDSASYVTGSILRIDGGYLSC